VTYAEANKEPRNAPPEHEPQADVGKRTIAYGNMIETHSARRVSQRLRSCALAAPSKMLIAVLKRACSECWSLCAVGFSKGQCKSLQHEEQEKVRGWLTSSSSVTLRLEARARLFSLEIDAR
jgi:hypothetical protein